MINYERDFHGEAIPVREAIIAVRYQWNVSMKAIQPEERSHFVNTSASAAEREGVRRPRSGRDNFRVASQEHPRIVLLLLQEAWTFQRGRH